ncbi:Histone-lysine N-methyltransferase PRDM9 [Frankliniella fusca]|uniref:Histone-lysine N-methyltransferase PRDM9 n=1 Tax=Frankliniella fusca TaxID=407009 RepID=A0AAE1HWX5_9NEOP|nr:Histone-lysine N-methyltransferase PRDM9 [Frankliniella fusca]
MDDEEYLDVSVVCRVCLAQNGNVDIFEQYEEPDTFLSGYTVAEKIMAFACVEILIDDGLPRQICDGCLLQINLACKLKAQCEYADTTLRQICSEGTEDSTSFYVLTDADSNRQTSQEVIAVMQDGSASPMVASESCAPSIVAMDSKKEVQTDTEVQCAKAIRSNLKETPSANKENESFTFYQHQFVEFRGDRNYEEAKDDPEQHSDVEIKNTKVSWKCSDCGELFSRRNQLAAHAISMPGHRPFVCRHCGKAFIRPSSLREHEKRHSESKGFLCNSCGQFAPNRKLHYCTVVNDKTNKTFTCDICEKKFVSHVTLFTHKKRHSTHSKYQCSECQKMFFSRQELERHLRVHSNVRPFHCPEDGCTLTFFTQGELNRHTRYHKGIRRFCCDVCGQKFFESGHLLSHVRKHTGERPYVCKHCPRTFLDSSKLQRHMKGHMKPSRKERRKGTTKKYYETVDLSGHEVSLAETVIKTEPPG